MSEIATYCERCGNTYSARYDPYRLCLVLSCEPCDYSELTIAAKDLLALPAGERERLHKLAERTAERNGEPLPTLFCASETEASATLTPKVLDLDPLKEAMAAFNTWMKEEVHAFAQACGLTTGLPRMPSVGQIHQFRPITSVVPPLATPFRVKPDATLDDLVNLEQKLALLRQCQRTGRDS